VRWDCTLVPVPIFLGAADQSGHLAAIALGEQRFQLRGVACLVDETHRRSRHPACGEFVFDGPIDGELVGIFRWCAAIAEHDLQPATQRLQLAGVGVAILAVFVALMNAHRLLGDLCSSTVRRCPEVG